MMGLFFSKGHVIVIWLMSAWLGLAQITSCPVSETTYTTGGSTYRICPGTDYQGNTATAVGATSDMACAAACNAYSGCTFAVFQSGANLCHIKSGGLNWVVNSRYDTARYVANPSSGQATTQSSSTTSTTTTTPIKSSTSTTTSAAASTSPPAQGSGITSCPSTETTLNAGGMSFITCPGSDFVGPADTILGNSPTISDCAQSCSGVTSCYASVYSDTYKVCYLKKSVASYPWVVDSRYTTLRTNRTISTGGGTTTGGPIGQWSAVISFPVIPVAGYIVPEQPDSSRILMFSSWGTDDFSGPTGITQFADFNFKTGAVSQRTVTNTNHDMFCPGISTLPDGRIIVSGGENAEATSLYDPTTNQFTRGPDLKIPRGYQTSCTLSDGRVFTLGGSFSGGLSGKNGEVFDAIANTWTLLPQANVTPMLTNDREGAFRSDNHGWLIPWRDGSVLQAGPSSKMNWYGTANGGSVTPAGIRDPTTDAMCGFWAMYDAAAGKVFTTGGSKDYTGDPTLNRAHIITLGAVGQPPQVEQITNMIHPRGFGNSAILPDGTIVITGGMSGIQQVFSDDQAVYVAELFDPVTRTFRELAAMKTPRNYHSISLLLPDGTVLAAGGGMCPTAYGQSDAHCNRTPDHPDGEIFLPPYLFNADGSQATRPVISALSSDTAANGFTVRVGGTLTVTMGDAADGLKFALVRISSATHSVNSDQRRYAVTNLTKNGAQWTLRLPTDSGILIPGMYYLFALSAGGVPCVAKTVKVSL